MNKKDKNFDKKIKKLLKTSFTIMTFLLVFIMLASCNNSTANESGDQQDGQENVTIENTLNPIITFDPNYDPAEIKMGFIMHAEDGELSYAAMHGFLRSAENLGYPAKLYTAPTSIEAAALVNNAIEDGCEGVLIWADSAEMLSAVSAAKKAGLKVIVPFETVGEGVADANFYQDESDYTAEAARILLERIKSREKTSGNIYVTGVEDHSKIFEHFSQVITKDYPSYKVVEFKAKSTPENVYETIKKDPDIVGLLALEEGSGEIWNDASNAVQSDLLKAIEPTPSPTPSDEPKKDKDKDKKEKSKESSSPKTTPSPTPEVKENPELEKKRALAKRYINVLLLDYTQENIKLVERGVVTGLIARPFYDSAAQSVYVMDRLFRGLPTQTDVLLNVPIIKKGYTAKYKGVMNEVNDWFNLEKKKPAATEVATSPSPEPEQGSPNPGANQSASPSPSPETESARASADPIPSPSN